jgi:MinD-like ATPase involved in chromosome partitioning or flagellar assembly
MSVVAFTSPHGSPGTTALLVAVAHHWAAVTSRTPLVVEADPDGGVLAARHQLAFAPGLTELAGAARLGIDPSDIIVRAQRFSSGVAVVPAHPSAEQTQAALRAAAGHLARAFAELPDHDVLLDIGRIRPGCAALPLLDTADRIVVVVRPDAEGVVALLHRAEVLQRHSSVQLVAVGRRPYSPDELRRSTGLDVITVPDDAGQVREDPGAARSLKKPWPSAVRALTQQLVAEAKPSRLVRR